ncbi:MAG: CDP-diacylglycerol--serine O-phosphatidyltransferase [Thermodesulfobacterium geofontis]|uniref:CDP-diacylglycerol--serine O-phosphatidyltransferase n=1 Tax=Thermodesulfobacterium geofontis TaxID=1295609 RepID=A0A2N7QB76_9BACT|nr:MAG: CDP-diacylglycerol--serine O-phosphatidyltransferase [Thermodesulfobacterium geofontis]PMP95662.1 MAG: CDP-diacylglycerol--serine O-phosphatidyltransferase [Thermodesulfobacterium geofontis]HEM55876.1 CDP-diacylglycerol--serine O-phosphatidyltransferase [Thermodesulfobium narugense]
MIYLLPHIFTTLNIFCGFFAIVKIIDGDFWKASWVIFLAILFDIFDGRTARFFKTSSKFGLEYDSLSDLVSFGVAPSLLIYQFSLKNFNKIGWLASFLYTICVALRLARFNVKIFLKSNYFEGLPSPAGAAILASSVLFLLKTELGSIYKDWGLLVLTYFIAYLLVSPIQYPSFKEFKIKKAQTFYFLVFFILGLTVIASNPSLYLFIIFWFYLLLGPLLFFKENGKKFWKSFLEKIKKLKEN